MNQTDKLCLKWEDFQENTTTSFRSLRETQDFSDVTLVCEDGEQIKAHKAIMSASSAFFHNTLIRNTHAHPIIYMRGVTADELTEIVDFMYFGEARIYQEKLANFLGVAEELKIKGLMGSLAASDGKLKFDITKQTQRYMHTSTKETGILTQNVKTENENISDTEETIETKESFSGNLQELNDKVNSLMRIGNKLLPYGRKVHICNVCGKEGKGSNIKQHIEAVHIDGISAPCEICEKTYG